LQRVPIAVLVVPEESATLGWEREKRVAMDADHITIAKFRSKEDTNYEIVLTELHRLVAGIEQDEGPQGSESNRTL
jgi:hypothetical protein